MKIGQTPKWTRNLSYVVGLFVTDGNLSKDRRHITFTSKDIELINNVISVLKLNNRVGITKNSKSKSFRIQIGNTSFYKWLIKIGLAPKKSLTLGPVNIPDQYFIDFLRGHLDGDGSITTYLDKYNCKNNPKYKYRRLFVRFISGSYKHILWLHKKIINIANVKGRMHISKPNHLGNSMYIIKFGKKESLVLLNKIYYKNVLPCLSRKRLIYESFIKSL